MSLTGPDLFNRASYPEPTRAPKPRAEKAEKAEHPAEPAAKGKPGESVAVGLHFSPQTAAQRNAMVKGQPLHLFTREGLVGEKKGYASAEAAENDVAGTTDGPGPAIAIIQNGKRWYAQQVEGVNNIGARVAYEPDELVDYGELNARITNGAVTKIVDGWTEINASDDFGGAAPAGGVLGAPEPDDVDEDSGVLGGGEWESPPLNPAYGDGRPGRFPGFAG